MTTVLDRPASRKHTASLRGLGAMMILLAVWPAGCAATRENRDAGFEPVVIRSASGELEAEVIGDLLSRTTPRPRERSWLARLLFGDAPQPRRRLRTPQGLCCAGVDQTCLYVCDQGAANVAFFDASEDTLRWFSVPDATLTAPLDVAVAPSGTVFVVDASAGLLVVPSRDVASWSSSWSTFSAPGDFRAASVAVNEALLAIGNAAGRRVDRFDRTQGQWLEPLEYGSDGMRIVAPTGLAYAADGSLLVADAVQGVVHRFAADGTPRPPIGRPGRGEGEFVRLKDVCVTPRGLVVATDAGRQSVLVFDADGGFLLEIPGPGGARGCGFTLPAGVTFLGRLACALPLDDAAPEYDGEYIVVSDALGPISLTLIELRHPRTTLQD